MTKQTKPVVKGRDRELREKAFELLDEGWTSEEAAELLDVKHMTVAGWMSWRTRGHYDDETPQPRVPDIRIERALREKRKTRAHG